MKATGSANERTWKGVIPKSFRLFVLQITELCLPLWRRLGNITETNTIILKEMKRTMMMILLAFLALGGAVAQEVTGRVVDEAGQPLGYATIRLRTLTDSLTIIGGVSLEDGTFNLAIEGQQFPLILEASLLGYTTAQKEISTLDGHTLTLSESAIMLEETVITAQKIPHKLVPGGLSTDISSSPLAQLPDIFSVLRGVPMLEIEGETIKVTGKGSPVIYLNDRLLTDYNQLKQIRPHLIDRVEVITNPGVRYSSSTQSVLKLYTRREPGSGLSGYLSARASHQLENPVISGYPYINLNYRTDHWDFFTTFYVSRNSGVNNNPLIEVDGRTEDGNWLNTSNTKFRWEGDDFSVTLGTNYTNDLQSAGAKYTFYGEQETMYGYNDLMSHIGSEDPIRYLSETITKGNWNYSHRPSLYYLRKLGDWTAQVDADFYYRPGNKKTQTVREGHTEAYELRELETSNGSSNKSAGARVNVYGPLWGGQLTIGADYVHTKNEFFNYNDQQLRLPDIQSHYNEDLLALYLEYAHNIGENWNISTGLRLEHLDSNYFVKDKKSEEQSRKYTNLFPSLSIGGRIGTVNTQLSFRSHINRPSYWRLQPQYQYISRFEYQSGNPTLRSNFSYNTQLMINKSWFTLMLYHIYIVDEMSQRMVRMPDFRNPGAYLPHTTLLEHFNANPYHVVNAILVISPTIGIWNPTLNLMAAKMYGYDLWNYEKKITERKPVFQANLQNTFSLPSDITLMLNLSIMSKGDFQNFYIQKPIINSYAQVSKKWLKDKQLSTSLSVDNLLNQLNTDVIVHNRYTTLATQAYSPMRFTFTISYRFNTTRDKYKGLGTLDSVIKRM